MQEMSTLSPNPLIETPPKNCLKGIVIAVFMRTAIVVVAAMFIFFDAKQDKQYVQGKWEATISGQKAVNIIYK